MKRGALADAVAAVREGTGEQMGIELALGHADVDGETYHRAWDGELVRRDQLRNLRLFELGWDVKRFWVYQVRDDLNWCVEQIVE